MFTYTVYGVTGVPSAQRNTGVAPITRTSEISPVNRSQASQATEVVSKQAERTQLHKQKELALTDPTHQSYVREIVRDQMDSLKFMGTRALLLEMRRPTDPPEPDYQKYTDELSDLQEQRSGAIGFLQEDQSQGGPQYTIDNPYAMGYAASVVLT